MSYAQAMKHWHNHRKQRFHQPIYFGDGQCAQKARRTMTDADRCEACMYLISPSGQCGCVVVADEQEQVAAEHTPERWVICVEHEDCMGNTITRRTICRQGDSGPVQLCLNSVVVDGVDGVEKYPHAEGNARLIEAACNACMALNPTDPVAAAEALPGLVGAFERLVDFCDTHATQWHTIDQDGSVDPQAYVADLVHTQIRRGRAAISLMKGPGDE